MTDTHKEGEREVELDIEEIAAKFGRLSLLPATRPSQTHTIINHNMEHQYTLETL